MFPSRFSRNRNQYFLVNESLSEKKLKELFIQRPYDVYAIVNETQDDENQPMLTTFQVLHSSEFENRVILYDISSQPHSTITTELYFLAKGYIEFIDVGQVDRYHVRFYIKEENR